MSYSKSNNRQREELLKIQQQTERGVTQNPTTDTERKQREMSSVRGCDSSSQSAMRRRVKNEMRGKKRCVCRCSEKLSMSRVDGVRNGQEEVEGAFEKEARGAWRKGVRVAYLTSWTAPRVRFSVNGETWREMRMRSVSSHDIHTTSPVTMSGNGSSDSARDFADFTRDGVAANMASNRGPPAAARWHEAQIDGIATRIELVFTDGYNNWDNPPCGGNYVATLPAPVTNAVSSSERARPPPSMTIRVGDGVLSVERQYPRVLLVSDLDGTMVGDDAAMRRFRDMWVGAQPSTSSSPPSCNGSKLVYNTGRSLASFMALAARSGDNLATPDMLIASVGTKIYNQDETGTYVENVAWTATLSSPACGWDLRAARDVAYTLLVKYGDEHVHFRPPDEQNEHKVTLGVAADIVHSIIDGVHDGIAKESDGFRAKVIVSGSGAWRFVDIVPRLAGKYESTGFVACS